MPCYTKGKEGKEQHRIVKQFDESHAIHPMV